ncbi:MAG: zinc ribbon domain-containing protein [Chloroflexi bacterium]|nr:zinc ribbon domain-containing protein [Chloroflexota bacterium]
MPTYGYRCGECGIEFEIEQSINENAPPACPDCGGRTNRVYYPVGIIFKGSGFHVTDYPSKKRAEKAPDEDAHKTEIPKSETPKSEKPKEVSAAVD